MARRQVYSFSDLLGKIGGFYSIAMVALRFLLDIVGQDFLYLDAFKKLYKTDRQLDGMKEKKEGGIENALTFKLDQKLYMVLKKLLCCCASETKTEKIVW